MSEPVRPPSHGVAGSHELRRGVLGTVDTVAQSLALLALALGVALSPAAAASTAGAAVPWAYIVAAAGSLALASVIVRFARRIAHTGNLYVYTARGLGPATGFVAGWTYAAAYAIGISFVLAIASNFLATILQSETSVHPGWFPLYGALLFFVLVLALLDVRISTRVQIVFATIGVLTILALSLIIVAKGGAQGLSGKPFDPSVTPSTHGLFLAVVLAFTAFIGFETAAVLGEEAANPLTSIPWAVLGTVVIASIYYIFVTWAMTIGYGVGHVGDFAKDPTALDTLATRYVAHWFAVLVDSVVVVDSFVAALAGTLLVSRTLFAMGRDRAIPRGFSWTLARTRSPAVGIAVAVILTILLGAFVTRHYGVFTYFFFMATTGSLGILTVWILVSAAGTVYFFRHRRGPVTPTSILLDFLLPAAAIAITVYTIYKSIWPRPPAPISYSLWIWVGWVVLGVLIAGFLALVNPERVRLFGKAFGGTEERAG